MSEAFNYAAPLLSRNLEASAVIYLYDPLLQLLYTGSITYPKPYVFRASVVPNSTAPERVRQRRRTHTPGLYYAMSLCLRLRHHTSLGFSQGLVLPVRGLKFRVQGLGIEAPGFRIPCERCS